MSNKQAGGIVSFVVIGLVLAGLLGGGLYLSKQQARQARDTDTTTPQVTAETDTESGATDKGNDAPATNGPQAAPKPAEPTPQTPQSRNTPATRPAPAAGGTNRVATTGPSDTIPATGPTETAALVLSLVVLTFASYRFVDARRGFLRSALRR